MLRFETYTVLLTNDYQVNSKHLLYALRRQRRNGKVIYFVDVSKPEMPFSQVTIETILQPEDLICTEVSEIIDLIAFSTKPLPEFFDPESLSMIVHMFRIMVLILNNVANKNKKVDCVGLSFNDNVDTVITEFHGLDITELSLKHIFHYKQNPFLESFVRDRVCDSRFELEYKPPDAENNQPESLEFQLKQKATLKIFNSAVNTPDGNRSPTVIPLRNDPLPNLEGGFERKEGGEEMNESSITTETDSAKIMGATETAKPSHSPKEVTEEKASSSSSPTVDKLRFSDEDLCGDNLEQPLEEFETYPQFLEKLFSLEYIKLVRRFFSEISNNYHQKENNIEEFAFHIVNAMIKGKLDPIYRIIFINDGSFSLTSTTIIPRPTPEISFNFFRKSSFHCYFGFFS